MNPGMSNPYRPRKFDATLRTASSHIVNRCTRLHIIQSADLSICATLLIYVTDDSSPLIIGYADQARRAASSRPDPLQRMAITGNRFPINRQTQKKSNAKQIRVTDLRSLTSFNSETITK
ncbi:hypothetical protein [Paraburkholderia fungorum]|uniref:hypothetical protein n=1 Tax=Paraburkholderia fungorum TaxID=134537 RepID=UPI00115FC903|nr:hypothetical protein [Paraburkholderia fungorum]